MKINTYLAMNTEIVGLLRMTASENPVTAYAAARIEQLETVNAKLTAACKSALLWLEATSDENALIAELQEAINSGR
jgi:hypothetical protein